MARKVVIETSNQAGISVSKEQISIRVANPYDIILPIRR